MIRYTFVYFTGYGYREIFAHTIKTYTLSVKAESFEEAAKKLEKKAAKASRYNDCFNSKGTIQVHEVEGKNRRTGIFWIQDKVVRWEGEICYWKPSAFGKAHMSSIKLPDVESYYGSWIADFCFGRITYSYVGWIKESIDRFDYTKFWSTASRADQIRDYKEYVIDEIQYLLNSSHCPEEDKIELKKLKLLEEL